jgi:FkbM family methyltransferase
MLKRTLENLFAKFGLSLMPNWRLKNREMVEHLQELFEQLRIDCVLDVGANRGQYRDFLRGEVGYTGQIISFEPVSDLAKLLRDRAQSDRQWTICDYALGDVETTATLNVTQGSQLSSFLQPAELPIGWTQPENVIVKKEAARIRRLDDCIGEIVGGWPNRRVYLKLDVQGFELQVAEGAQKSLSNIAALQSEVPLLSLYEGMADFSTSITHFRDRGFDVSGMFVVSRDGLMRIIDFDCVMLNTALAKASKGL